MSVGDAVVWQGRSIGELLAADHSPTLDHWLGVALVDSALAHAGLSEFTIARGASLIPIRTLSAPPINNRSLYVDPQRHSYRTRAGDEFPPVRTPS
jgi:glycine cleavage system aminomethyltransferase T